MIISVLGQRVALISRGRFGCPRAIASTFRVASNAAAQRNKPPGPTMFIAAPPIRGSSGSPDSIEQKKPSRGSESPTGRKVVVRGGEEHNEQIGMPKPPKKPHPQEALAEAPEQLKLRRLQRLRAPGLHQQWQGSEASIRKASRVVIAMQVFHPKNCSHEGGYTTHIKSDPLGKFGPMPQKPPIATPAKKTPTAARGDTRRRP